MKSDNRRITVAENSGFCFGVKRATDLLAKKIAERGGDGLYTLGKLIHNDTYTSRIEAEGVRISDASELDFIAGNSGPERPVEVFIRAHGVTDEVHKKLDELSSRYEHFSYIDCTCPYVEKIHRIAEECSSEKDGKEPVFILLGTENHPEVVGIVSYFKGRSFVFPDCASLKAAQDSLPSDSDVRIYAAAQTTSKLSEWEKFQLFLKKLYTKPIIFDTICRVTEKRQTEAETLASKCDFMVVIGGQDSSNTSKLYSVCRAVCPNTVCVSCAAELAGKIPNKCINAGIVAGASTPGDIIEEVYHTMSEEIKAGLSFDEMLDSACKTLNSGDTVTGTVIAVNDQEIKLDLGAKVTGILTADQTTDDASLKLSSEFKIGDEIDVFVIRVSDVDGTATVSKKRADLDKNWSKVIEAKENGTNLEGKVYEAVKGGVVIKVYGARVFVPASQTTVAKDGDLSVLVGKTVKFKVIELKPQGKSAVGSIRAAAREERKEVEDKFWSEIEVGKYYDGTVRGLTEYGAFIDLGGVDGMLHKKDLSWKPIHRPADVLNVGDPIRVFVKTYDPETKRISLGYITEENNPWTLFKAQYAVGDEIDVTISNLMTYGAFAHITDEVDGLIHISQISTERVNDPKDVLSKGQEVRVKITKIEDEQQRVSLSIRALDEDAPADFDGEAADEAQTEN